MNHYNIMSLKTVSLISLTILTLVFVLCLVRLYFVLENHSELDTYTLFQFVDTLLWIPFILFFWKIYKG